MLSKSWRNIGHGEQPKWEEEHVKVKKRQPRLDKGASIGDGSHVNVANSEQERECSAVVPRI